MMDENKLAGLFQDATHDAPPASFDVSDIRSASRRATMRRRNAIAAGSTLVVVLGFGGVVASAGWLGQEKAATTSAEGAGQATDNSAESPLSAPAVPPREQQNFPGDVSTQGDASKPGSPDPRVGGSAVQGCAAVDRELADALAGELSVSTTFAEPPTVTCSPKSRSAMFKIDGLTITAIVTPDEFEAPAGAVEVKTAKGQDLYVFTQGDGELKGQAKRFADALAPKF